MIQVDVVTPTRKLVEGATVANVRLPSSKGELTILPGHTQLLTLLGTGILAFTEDGRERRFAVSYGFAEVSHNRVLVLAETAEEQSEIDTSRAKSAQKRAEEHLVGTMTPEEFKKQQLKLQRALIRQQVAGLSH